MRQASFASPQQALAALVDILNAADATGATLAEKVHVGPLESGAGLDCCPSLLRVESSTLRPGEGEVLLGNRRCDPLILEIVVTYRRCFATSTENGDEMPTEQLTAAGLSLIGSWWTALTALMASPHRNKYRFALAQDIPAEGACAGWVMRFTADLAVCP